MFRNEINGYVEIEWSKNMNFFEKSLKDLVYKDIFELLENKIPESATIEYKGLGYLDKNLNHKFDDNRLDFVKKVCSFANTSGGYILFGIKEEVSGLDIICSRSQELEYFNLTDTKKKGILLRLVLEKNKSEEECNYSGHGLLK